MSILGKALSVILTISIVAALYFYTSFLDWTHKEDPAELFAGGGSICQKVVVEGDACEQILYVKPVSSAHMEIIQDVALEGASVSKQARISTPSTLKIVGRRMCVNTSDFLFSEQTSVIETVDGQEGAPRHPSAQEVGDFHKRARTGRPDTPDYICMTLQKVTGSDRYLMKSYSNEYFGAPFQKFIARIGPVDATMRLKVLTSKIS